MALKRQNKTIIQYFGGLKNKLNKKKEHSMAFFFVQARLRKTDKTILIMYFTTLGIIQIVAFLNYNQEGKLYSKHSWIAGSSMFLPNQSPLTNLVMVMISSSEHKPEASIFVLVTYASNSAFNCGSHHLSPAPQS